MAVMTHVTDKETADRREQVALPYHARGGVELVGPSLKP